MCHMSEIKVGIVCAGSMAKKMAGVLAKMDGIRIAALACLGAYILKKTGKHN